MSKQQITQLKVTSYAVQFGRRLLRAEKSGKFIPVDEFREWTKTLRSGQYTQGTHWLKNNGCYCCLGVYAEMHSIEIGPEDEILDAESFPKNHVLSNEHIQMFLAELNDGGTFEPGVISFEQIADVIDQGVDHYLSENSASL